MAEIPPQNSDVVTITTQPTDTTVLVSTSFTLTVVAESDDETATLSYQWQYYNDSDNAWHDIGGGTDSTYTANTPAVATTVDFRCVVTSDKGGTATSNAVTLDVVATDTITITQQPVGATVYIQSAPYPFYLEAESNIEGATLSYQWYYWVNNQWGSLANATTNPYNYTATSTPETRKFRCRVRSDLGGEVYSEEFEMTYIAVPIVGQKFILGSNSSTPYYATSTIGANGDFVTTRSAEEAAVWEFVEGNKIRLYGTDNYIDITNTNSVALTTTGVAITYTSVTYSRTGSPAPYWKLYMSNGDGSYLYNQTSSSIGFKWNTTATYNRIFFVD